MFAVVQPGLSPAQTRGESTVIEIRPGQDVQAYVAAAPPGSTFLLRAGVHRMHTIRPRGGDTFLGEPGAVLSGARLLVTFARSGGTWVADGQTQQGVRHGSCQSAYPRCSFPEQLFIDDKLLSPVATLGEVRAETWYFDYAVDRIYLGSDPTGRRVETSVATTAFEATGDSVTISNLIIEKYANLAQSGAIHADSRKGWVISDNEVRWNHGMGIRIGPGARVTGNNVHHNGQLGIGGSGANILIERNEIAYNNTLRFDPNWEAGGTKFVSTTGLTVRDNFVHHNAGPGLWTDTDNLDTLYEGNTCEDNDRMGIVHEISYDAVIRNNKVRRNGFAFPDWIWGSGILIAASPNVEVHGNVVEDNADGIGAVQQRRGSGAYGPYEISNLWVHDNDIAMKQGWTGLVQDVGDSSYFVVSRRNRFENNRYRLASGAASFAWWNSERTESQWKNYGQDVLGTFRVEP